MRNQYGGDCYRCSLWVRPGDGHFEKRPGGGWRVQHASCAIRWRGQQPTVEEARAARARECDSEPMGAVA